jgi:hypothetical protein
MPHLRKKKTISGSKKPNGYCSWNLQYWFLPYQSRGISYFTTPILQGCSFESLLVVWYLTLSSKWGQHFLMFVSIHEPISCNFSSIHSRFFLFSFCSTVIMLFKILPLFCILLFYKALLPQDIFYKTLVNILFVIHTL